MTVEELFKELKDFPLHSPVYFRCEQISYPIMVIQEKKIGAVVVVVLSYNFEETKP